MSVKVYQRDCSWFANGRGGSGGKYHFVGESGASKCGKALMLDTDSPRNPADVAPQLRCKAKGCNELWADPIPAERLGQGE